MSVRIRAIAAMAANRVIGRNGTIPWHISDELRWFKKVTTGHAILMGRKTFDSLGRPLPNRQNLVVTRQAEPIEGVELIHDLDRFDPQTRVRPGSDLFIIGGGEIYARMLPRCEELLLTHVHRKVEGDTFFPEFESLFEPKETVLTHPEFEVRRYVRRTAEARQAVS